MNVQSTEYLGRAVKLSKETSFQIARRLMLVVFIAVMTTSMAQGQLESSTDDLERNYLAAIEELRAALKATNRAQVIHFHVESDMAYEYREQWEAAAEEATQAFAKVKRYGLDLFLAEENPDEDLVKIIRSINGNLYKDGEITLCYEVSRKLASLYPDDPDLARDYARVAILCNDFDAAAAYMPGNMGIIKEFPKLEKGLYAVIDQLQSSFKRELNFRAAEKSSDDLPRVKFETSKGEIVVELFEDQAPETVSNFLYLADIGFYQEMYFNVVSKTLMAQTGSFPVKGPPRFAGYYIYDECNREDARGHFRGSICMATPVDVENAGSSVFYILQVPGPHMKGRHTVFGRVISGMDVVDSLQPTITINDEGKEEPIKEITPDVLKSVTILRKRDHEYVPNRVKKPEEKPADPSK